MLGKMVRSFKFIDLNLLDYEEYDEEDVIVFQKGEVVEIVQELKDETFSSGKGYVILSAECESITLDSTLIEIIK